MGVVPQVELVGNQFSYIAIADNLKLREKIFPDSRRQAIHLFNGNSFRLLGFNHNRGAGTINRIDPHYPQSREHAHHSTQTQNAPPALPNNTPQMPKVYHRVVGRIESGERALCLHVMA